MKTRVLSVRVPYQTIAYCYLLQQMAGRYVKGRPVSTIVGDTLEAIIEASRKMQRIPEVTEERAEELVKEFADFIPGFEGVVPRWKQQKELDGAVKRADDIFNKVYQQQPVVEPTAKPTAAVKEETRPTEPQSAEQSLHLEQQAERSEASTQYKMPDVSQRIPVDIHIEQEEFVQEYLDDVVNPRVSEERLPEEKVVDSVELAAQAEIARDEQALRSSVDVGVLERVSPNVEQAEKPKCPWLGAVSLGPDDIGVDQLYEEAKEAGELMKVAVEVVYAALPKEQWSSDLAVKLVKKTYADYKAWEEKYGTKEQAS